MRIALVTSEFVGTASRGGIGTYMSGLAGMLASRGHEVEAFVAGDQSGVETRPDGVRINLVETHDRALFSKLVTPVFLARHTAKPFDVAEGPEFMAETAGVSKAAPDLPMVIKLHTPGVLISKIDADLVAAHRKLRFVLGALRRGRLPKPYWKYHRNTDYEFANLSNADEITSPCKAMIEAMRPIWKLDTNAVTVIPNVFVPPAELLEVPVETSTETVTFIGRLEARKGIFDLADAIPLVLAARPNARFRLIGRSLPDPNTRQDIGILIRQRLAPLADRVEMIPGLPYAEAIQAYAKTDICVFPSIWENFPNVCLEAMSAARGIVASRSGGMAEIIRHGKTGLLIPPRSPAAIADAILRMLSDPARRFEIGRAARQHVAEAYGVSMIAPLQEASYRKAIVRRQHSGARKFNTSTGA